jgi:hypothetical protein
LVAADEIKLKSTIGATFVSPRFLCAGSKVVECDETIGARWHVRSRATRWFLDAFEESPRQPRCRDGGNGDRERVLELIHRYQPIQVPNW